MVLQPNYTTGQSWTGTGRSFGAVSAQDSQLVSIPNATPLADPELALGKNQAVAAYETWKSELEFGFPILGQLYYSPSARAADMRDSIRFRRDPARCETSRHP